MCINKYIIIIVYKYTYIILNNKLFILKVLIRINLGLGIILLPFQIYKYYYLIGY